MAERGESLRNGRLWLAFATMLLVSGIGNTFPVFFPALLAEFGGSRATTASTVSLSWLGGAVLGPVAGYLVARRDPRRLVSLGLGAVVLGLTAGALAPSLVVFILAVGLGSGIGIGLTGMAVQAALLADAYVRRRGVAMGVAFAGSMAGYALAPPVQWAITRFGWRAALAGYVVAVAILVPLTWRTLPARLVAGTAGGAAPAAGGEPALRDIVALPAFWVLLVHFATPPFFGYLATTQHALYFTARGFSAEEASVMLAVGGVLAASGRVLFGVVADRLGAPLAGFVSLGVSLAGMLCLLGIEVWGLEAWPMRLLAYGYVLLLFLPMGSRATIVAVLVTRITPAAHYGVVFGLLGIGNNLGAASGPLISGAIYDQTGSYLAIYLVALGVLLASLLTHAVFCRLTRRAATSMA